MVVLGLTGSIGMGKSATCDMFRARGVAVHDSDATVHELYAGEATPLIEQAFPGVARNGKVDRALLAARVLGHPEELKRLEAVVHPLVRAREAKFLAENQQSNSRFVVLDIPLLFESRNPATFDAILVVTAPIEIQKVRVLSRPGMTAEKFAAITAKQMPDQEKRQRAHYLINTADGFSFAKSQVDAILRSLASRQKERILNA